MLIKAQDQKVHPSIMNCRRLNSYVASALSTWSIQSAIMASIPRQLGSAAQNQASDAAGTSSFGMSGTNAHLITAIGLTLSDHGEVAYIWSKAR